MNRSLAIEPADARAALALWADREAGLVEALMPVARGLDCAAGQALFRAGEDCAGYVVVASGCVRVTMTSGTGREILLYRVRPGESCILTTSCLVGGALYPAEGLCEEDTRLLMLPKAAFRDLLDRSPGFRRRVFESFGGRIADLIGTIDAAVFHRIDERLAALLVERARGGRLAATHQAIADELGTAREVVSRKLKAFERAGHVTLSRGAIAVRRPQALRRIAAGTG